MQTSKEMVEGGKGVQRKQWGKGEVQMRVTNLTAFVFIKCWWNLSIRSVLFLPFHIMETQLEKLNHSSEMDGTYIREAGHLSSKDHFGKTHLFLNLLIKAIPSSLSRSAQFVFIYRRRWLHLNVFPLASLFLPLSHWTLNLDLWGGVRGYCSSPHQPD